MDDFFSSIYSWFCDSSLNVFKIMNTVVGDDDELLMSSFFPTIGVTTLLISIVVAFAFYIWPINHPRFKSWWSWLIMMAVNAGINFGLAFAFIKYRISSIEWNMEKLGEFEQFEDFTTAEGTLQIPSAQCVELALSNLCVSVMFFIIASLILNWFSTNCKFSPFRK